MGILELTLDITDPDSLLSQLSGYVRSLGLRFGWLTNGRILTIWRFDNPTQPFLEKEIDLQNLLKLFQNGGLEAIPTNAKQDLHYLWENFQKASFSDWDKIERELALDAETWKNQALPLAGNEAHQEMLVGSVKNLLHDLQADARNILDTYFVEFAEYERKSKYLHDTDDDLAQENLESKRQRCVDLLGRSAPLVGMQPQELAEIESELRELERDPRTFLNTKELLANILETINKARARKFEGNKSASAPWKKYDNGLTELGEALKNYGDTVFIWHQRQAMLRQTYRKAIETHDYFTLWISLVQETMLGGFDEDQRRDEFALQAAYVVFIRLLLIRVCEDKEIFPHRFVSDGGLKRWQEDIERYFVFATGNPYDTLLDMAYQNAQNIYAHFFTGRELFNWYSLNRNRFIRVLQQLNTSPCNFSQIMRWHIGCHAYRNPGCSI